MEGMTQGEGWGRDGLLFHGGREAVFLRHNNHNLPTIGLQPSAGPTRISHVEWAEVAQVQDVGLASRDGAWNLWLSCRGPMNYVWTAKGSRHPDRKSEPSSHARPRLARPTLLPMNHAGYARIS